MNSNSSRNLSTFVTQQLVMRDLLLPTNKQTINRYNCNDEWTKKKVLWIILCKICNGLWNSAKSSDFLSVLLTAFLKYWRRQKHSAVKNAPPLDVDTLISRYKLTTLTYSRNCSLKQMKTGCKIKMLFIVLFTYNCRKFFFTIIKGCEECLKKHSESWIHLIPCIFKIVLHHKINFYATTLWRKDDIPRVAL